MGEREPRKGKIPEWAKQERLADNEWIKANLHIFAPVSKAQFEEHGRGALVVDTTKQPIPGGGHPYGYFPQEQIEEHDDEDTKRLVREYNPKKEFVVMLLKAEDRTSTYRIRPQSKRKRRKR